MEVSREEAEEITTAIENEAIQVLTETGDGMEQATTIEIHLEPGETLTSEAVQRAILCGKITIHPPDKSEEDALISELTSGNAMELETTPQHLIHISESGVTTVHPSSVLDQPRPFPCRQCDKSFNTIPLLRQHNRVHTGEHPYQCQYCERAFKNRSNLNRHTRLHTGLKPYKCTDCGKAFTQSSGMKEHYKIHLRQRGELVEPPISLQMNFQCSICPKAFSTPKKLSRHVRNHENRDNRPFVCATCDHTFRRQQHLDRHNLTHTGQKNFQCHICARRFVHKYDLDIHIRRHNKETPYKCDLCPMGFCRSGELKKHQERHKREQEGGEPYHVRRWTKRKTLAQHAEKSTEEEVTTSTDAKSKSPPRKRRKKPAKVIYARVGATEGADGATQEGEDEEYDVDNNEADDNDSAEADHEDSAAEDSEDILGEDTIPIQVVQESPAKKATSDADTQVDTSEVLVQADLSKGLEGASVVVLDSGEKPTKYMVLPQPVDGGEECQYIMLEIVDEDSVAIETEEPCDNNSEITVEPTIFPTDDSVATNIVE